MFSRNSVKLRREKMCLTLVSSFLKWDDEAWQADPHMAGGSCGLQTQLPKSPEGSRWRNKEHQIHLSPDVWGYGWASKPSEADTTDSQEPISQIGSVPTKKATFRVWHQGLWKVLPSAEANKEKKWLNWRWRKQSGQSTRKPFTYLLDRSAAALEKLWEKRKYLPAG